MAARPPRGRAQRSYSRPMETIRAELRFTLAEDSLEDPEQAVTD
jgi:hypothetical protein